MRKILTLITGIIATLSSWAQDFEFQYQGQSLADGATVTITAEEDLFGDLSCETNSAMNPTDGLMLKLLTGTSASVSATLEIKHNTLNASCLQWCMGGNCTQLGSQTSLTKQFTLEGSRQVQFDAVDIKSEGYLIATLEATIGVKSRKVIIQFVNGNITPEENQVWWGYFNESDFETGDYTIGTGSAMTLMAAIYIPANHEQLGNASIMGCRVYLPSSALSYLSNLRIWVSKTLPDKIGDADVVQTVLGTLTEGANDSKFRNPYEVNNEGFYVGYCVKSTTGYFIRSGGADAPNAFWIGNPEEGMGWSDLNGNGLGKLAFQILVKNGNFPQNSATVEDFGQNLVLLGEETSIPITITNMGQNTINTISYTITTEGGSTTDEKEISVGSLPLNGSKTLSIPFTSDAEPRKYRKTFTITQVDGKPNTASSNSATGFLITLKEKQPVTPVIEEFTGTWCGWCPRGTVGMEKVHEAYGDQVVQIAVHSGDPMEISAYSSVLNAFCDGYPGSVTDRMYGADPTFSGLKGALNEAFNRVSPATIGLTAEWDSEAQKKVIFTTTTRFSYSDDNGQYGIAFVLVEDGLKGTGSNWAQQNVYSGNGTGDMAWWGEQGTSVSGIEYNHVAVAGWSVQNGVNNSINPTITAGEDQKYTYTATLPTTSPIQDKTKLKAVALLIDRTNGTIVNAAQSAIVDFGTSTQSNIIFADSNVKAICVAIGIQMEMEN